MKDIDELAKNLATTFCEVAKKVAAELRCTEAEANKIAMALVDHAVSLSCTPSTAYVGRE